MAKVVVVEVSADFSKQSTQAVVEWMRRGLTHNMGVHLGLDATTRIYSATMYRLEYPQGLTCTDKTHKLVIRTDKGAFHLFQQYGGSWNWTNVARGI